MKEERPTLRPARPELRVPDPTTGRDLAPDGEPKPLTTYWRRRIADGDVVEVKAAKPAKE